MFTSKPAAQLKKEGWTEKEDQCIDKYRYMGPCVTNLWNKNNRICVFPAPSMIQTIRSWKPDVVHIFTPTIIGYFLFPWIRAARVPIYASHHVDMVYYITKYMPYQFNFNNLFKVCSGGTT